MLVKVWTQQLFITACGLKRSRSWNTHDKVEILQGGFDITWLTKSTAGAARLQLVLFGSMSLRYSVQHLRFWFHNNLFWRVCLQFKVCGIVTQTKCMKHCCIKWESTRMCTLCTVGQHLGSENKCNPFSSGWSLLLEDASLLGRMLKRTRVNLLMIEDVTDVCLDSGPNLVHCCANLTQALRRRPWLRQHPFQSLRPFSCKCLLCAFLIWPMTRKAGIARLCQRPLMHIMTWVWG